MQAAWLNTLKAAIVAAKSLRRYWKVLCGLVWRVFLLDEKSEQKKLQNTALYLKLVDQQLQWFKKNGATPAELRRLALELSLPLIQANHEAMLIARKYSKFDRPDPMGSESRPEAGALSDHSPSNGS